MRRTPSPRPSVSGRSKPAPERSRVLLVGEGSTLAHAARPLALAAALPKTRFEVFLALPERYLPWTPPYVRALPLKAQPPAEFAERLRSGRPLFSRSRLDAYFDDDLELLRTVGAKAVVGDFRLSLAASAREAGVPYVAISNAYWSPDRPLHPIRPTLDRFRRWPAPVAELAFDVLAAPALRWHAGLFDDFLTAHGRPPLGKDIRRVFTEADVTLYADLPELFPDLPETPRRRFLGPLVWEPPLEPPDWWTRLPEDKPIAYLTLGSSGEPRLLTEITGWLTGMGYAVMLATAGQGELHGDDETVFVADYLPGFAACELADLVVCNGGSPTVTQALLKGRPVLGICSNMDQFLNMRAVRGRGAGLRLRADALGRRGFEAAVDRLSGFKAMKAATSLAAGVKATDPGRVLSETLESLISS